jgi:hypothetical protein
VTRVLATAGYLAITLTVSYSFWGPYDGVEYDPEWAMGVPFFVALVAPHVVAGMAIGRWWALSLPLAWAVLSIPAGGYDVPVAVLIAFGSFYWMPAVFVGVAVRRILRSRVSSNRDQRLVQ